MLAAEILIPTPNEQFPTPYLYVSNRNDPSPEGDTISIFAIADDTLDLISEVSTGLNHVRGMMFGGPNSEWLVAGGTNGGGVKVFQRVEEGKNLEEVAHDPSIQSPTGFAWL
jgi:6-phosphogluconolactonase (cycloisomerase 2 family)